MITPASHLPHYLLLHYISPAPSPPARTDTVCDNTNTSFCHCRRANRPCYPTQTVTPKESAAHFHNAIDRALKCNTGWKYGRTPHVVCMSITSVPAWDEQSQFEAPLHIQHPPYTQESRDKAEEPRVPGDRKWCNEGRVRPLSRLNTHTMHQP